METILQRTTRIIEKQADEILELRLLLQHYAPNEYKRIIDNEKKILKLNGRLFRSCIKGA